MPQHLAPIRFSVGLKPTGSWRTISGPKMDYLFCLPRSFFSVLLSGENRYFYRLLARSLPTHFPRLSRFYSLTKRSSHRMIGGGGVKSPKHPPAQFNQNISFYCYYVRIVQKYCSSGSDPNINRMSVFMMNKSQIRIS